MHKPNIKAHSLEEYHQLLSNELKLHHGKEYLANHDALTNLIHDNPECQVVKEMGVCQGGTLAAILLAEPKKVIALDHIERYIEPNKHLFDQFAEHNGIDLQWTFGDSLNPNNVDECDILHIDTTHEPKHLEQELMLHARSVRRFIVFHDTCDYGKYSGLLPVIAKYITLYDQNWKIVEHYIHRVGYTVIERVKRLPYLDRK